MINANGDERATPRDLSQFPELWERDPHHGRAHEDIRLIVQSSERTTSYQNARQQGLPPTMAHQATRSGD